MKPLHDLPAPLLATAALAPVKADGPDGYTALDGSWVAASPLLPEADGLPADAAEAILRLRFAASPQHRDAPFGPACPGRVVAVLNGVVAPRDESRFLWESVDTQALVAILSRDDVPIRCLTRLCLAGDHDLSTIVFWELAADDEMIYGVGPILGRRFRAGGDLRHVLAAREGTGVTFEQALTGMIERRVAPIDDGPANPTVWAAFATRFDLLDEVLRGTRRASDWINVGHELTLLDYFPKTPLRYLDLLLDKAITGAMQARRAARRRLEERRDVVALVAPLLRAADPARRAKAAAWLGDRHDPAAVAPLRAALADETAIAPRAALLAALVACGDDVGDAFAPDRLQAEAEAGLGTLRTNYSALFHRDHLPELRWADGTAVPKVIVKFWFARAHKLKRPGGDPLLHMALDRLDRADAARLGDAVLAAFIAADTQRPDLETANAHAEANVADLLKYGTWQPIELTPEVAFAMLRRKKLKSYTGTAIAHRGLLALARHAPAPTTVATTLAFMRAHKTRVAQAKALVEVLAASPDPRALRAVVSISRTPSNRARRHARALLDSVAAAEGWSATELAERMMPTAGLDDGGALALPLGGRTFRARLDAAGTGLQLHHPDGSPITALPRARNAAEKAEGAAARKTLAATAKALGPATAEVRDRLYQAMCAGRSWSAADFSTVVLGHPIAGRLASRAIFVGLDADGAPTAAFRPLADGSFTDADDGALDLTRFARVALAHRSSLGEAAEAWRSHFADYAIDPLFDQLTRPLVAAPDAESRELDVVASVPAVALDAVAKRLGYAQGRMSSGRFDTYEKPFIDLGLEAAVLLSDTPVTPVAGVAVTLRGARLRRFRPDGDAGFDRQGRRLAQVPPILLAELWHDLAAFAAATDDGRPA